MADSERITALSRDLNTALARADCIRRTLREAAEAAGENEPSWISLFWLEIENLSNAAEAYMSGVASAQRL